jgi:hypothetical protein
MPAHVTRSEWLAMSCQLSTLERSSHPTANTSTDKSFSSNVPTRPWETYVPLGRCRVLGQPAPIFASRNPSVLPRPSQSFWSRSNRSPVVPWSRRLSRRLDSVFQGVINDNLFLNCPHCYRLGRSSMICSSPSCRFTFPCFIYTRDQFAQSARDSARSSARSFQ